MYDKETQTDGIQDKLVVVNRTAKVVKGGRRFGFNALVVAGDGNGRIGFGSGKAVEVPNAIKKANESARRNMRKFELKGKTLQHATVGQHGATKVWLSPASEGTGIIAGSAMRAIFEVMGVENVLTKVIGSTTPINVVRATIKALTQMMSPEMVAEKRGKSVEQVLQ